MSNLKRPDITPIYTTISIFLIKRVNSSVFFERERGSSTINLAFDEKIEPDQSLLDIGKFIHVSSTDIISHIKYYVLNSGQY